MPGAAFHELISFAIPRVLAKRFEQRLLTPHFDV
jgi:hypothetical protein